MAHTPGPWTVAVSWSAFSEIRGPNGELIFELTCGVEGERQTYETCAANVGLIELAPDLLEALQDALAAVHTAMLHADAEMRGHEIASEYRAIVKRWEEKARAVIAKATGET